MRAYLMIPLAALALAACNKADTAADADLNAAGDNMMVDANGAAMTDGMDANGAMTGGVDGNMATGTEAEMNKDLNTNDADTNLANGL